MKFSLIVSCICCFVALDSAFILNTTNRESRIIIDICLSCSPHHHLHQQVMAVSPPLSRSNTRHCFLCHYICGKCDWLLSEWLWTQHCPLTCGCDLPMAAIDPCQSTVLCVSPLPIVPLKGSLTTNEGLGSAAMLMWCWGQMHINNTWLSHWKTTVR